jgi:transcriptional regulator with XRE-family HTH domain
MESKPQDPPRATQQQWQRFGELVRDRRNAARLSRLELAQRTQLSAATIKFVETARHQPSRATLIRLLAVAELELNWAEVPGPHEPPAAKQDTPAPPPPPPAPPASVEPNTDPAQFLMNLIGFDEIRLPPGAPKNLRIFQERDRAGEQAGGKNLKEGSEDE